MMNETVIHLRDVTLKYRLTSERIESLKDFMLKTINRSLKYSDFYALKSINLSIQRGERVGIIGHNGAGKSTLLRVIAGVVSPTEGKISVSGEVAPLLELGAGFDFEFSGHENIYLNAAIMGKSKRFIDERYDDIVRFAELGEFLHAPVKNYSSGMRSKLGFSIAIQTSPDILLIDEVLGVGDARFKKKSIETLSDIMGKGITTIMVSHNLAHIEKLTDKVIWLQKGELREIGETKEVLKHYVDQMEGLNEQSL
jgi:ABC-type polysaccharide/polyol phosphate transport system ATPase subunit